MTTTQSTDDERDIRDQVSALWPPLTPVIVTLDGCEITGPRDELLGYAPDVTLYGYVVAHRIRETSWMQHPQRFIVIRESDGADQYYEISVGDAGEFAMYAAHIERDGVTEAFPSDALAAYESNPEHFGDLVNDLVAEGALLPE